MRIFFKRRFSLATLLLALFAKQANSDSLQELRNRSYKIPTTRIITVQETTKKKETKQGSSLDFSFLENDGVSKTRVLSSYQAKDWLPSTLESNSSTKSMQITTINPTVELPRELVLKQIYLLDRQRFLKPHELLSQLQQIQSSYPNAWQSYDAIASYHWNLNQYAQAKIAFQKAFQVVNGKPPELLKQRYLKFLQESKNSE